MKRRGKSKGKAKKKILYIASRFGKKKRRYKKEMDDEEEEECFRD